MIDLVTRLRDWRTVHLARLHLLMEEAADQLAILESKISLRENLEQGLMAGVARLQAEVERLRNGALEARETVSQNGDFPEPENVANEDNDRRLAALQALTDLDEELRLPRRTPNENATPSEGSEQSVCTITDPRWGRLWSDQ